MCNACAAGKSGIAMENGNVGCEDCLIGRYRGDDDIILTECVLCETGRYAEAEGLPFCISCDAGTFSENMESRNCTQCPSGYYVKDKGEVSCKQCESGKISTLEMTGNTACIVPGWITIADCELFEEYLDNSNPDVYKHVCEPCREGMVCGSDCKCVESITNAKHKPGYWNVTWRIPPSIPKDIAIKGCHKEERPGYFPCKVERIRRPWTDPLLFPCPYPANCLANSSCMPGSHGIACAVCEKEHFRTTLGTCEECTVASVTSRMGILITFIGLFLIVVIIIKICQRRISKMQSKAKAALQKNSDGIDKAADIASFAAAKYARALQMGVRYGGATVKMLFVFLQISASTPEVLDLQFPDIYLQFLSYFDWLDFNFISLLGLDCIGELDYRSEVGISCLVPTLIVVLGVIVYQCQNKGSKVLGKDEKRKFAVASKTERHEAVCGFFDRVDNDRSGEISVIEFKSMLKELAYHNLDDDHVQSVMTLVITYHREGNEGTQGRHHRHHRRLRHQRVDAFLVLEHYRPN